MSRNRWSDRTVAALKPQPKRFAVPDPELAGHYVRIQPSGAKSFVCVTVDGTTGKQVWTTLGPCSLLKVKEAQEAARAAMKRVRAGQPGKEAPVAAPATFDAVASDWYAKHVMDRGLRSRGEIKRVLDKYLRPEWGDRPFVGIRRADVVALLDDVAENNGKAQANHVLGVARSMMSWYASRSDDYVSPIVQKMRRAPPVARERTLEDHELGMIWKAAVGAGRFGAIVRLLLLSGQRRSVVAAMRWQDLDGSKWSIPREPRAKGTPAVVTLPDTAMDIIAGLPRLEGSPYVFWGRAGSHFNGWSKAKREFDSLLPKKPKPIAAWTVHDLRRTARSLMARAGVGSEVAERTLGHAIAGVEGIYDRHRYETEIANALKSLGSEILSVVNK